LLVLEDDLFRRPEDAVAGRSLFIFDAAKFHRIVGMEPDNLISLHYHNIVNMPTTIQVQDDVYKMLNALKKDLEVESYNEVIRHLLKKSKRMDQSEFGSMPGIAPFQREEIDRFD
jgi:predicted CopG family antitoxin